MKIIKIDTGSANTSGFLIKLDKYEAKQSGRSEIELTYISNEIGGYKIQKKHLMVPKGIF